MSSKGKIFVFGNVGRMLLNFFGKSAVVALTSTARDEEVFENIKRELKAETEQRRDDVSRGYQHTVPCSERERFFKKHSGNSVRPVSRIMRGDKK